MHKNIRMYHSMILSGLLVSSLILLASQIASADSVIGMSYTVAQDMPPGTIVSTDHTNGGVVAANTNNIEYLFGVVAASDQSLLSFNASGGKHVQVATNGIAQMFVSDINGIVSAGDAITPSIISGVGMKATDNVKIIGIAQSNFKDAQNKRDQTIQKSDGTKQVVHLAAIPAIVNLSYYYKQQTKSVIPAAIQEVANTVGGRNVPSLPIIASVVIFFMATVIIGWLVYGAIRASIISIGRNPMSQSAVYRNLLQVSVLILTILVGSLGSIYFILSKS